MAILRNKFRNREKCRDGPIYIPFQEANQVSDRQVQTSILELLLAFIFDLDAILAETEKTSLHAVALITTVVWYLRPYTETEEWKDARR